MQRNIDFDDSGALEQNHHDSHPFEYQTNTFQTCAMGDMVSDGQIDDMMDNARTLDGEEMRIGWEREQAIAQGVMRRPSERVDPDNQSMPLEMIERINGEVDELEQQYETAHRAKAAEHNREEACAEDVTNRERVYETKGHGWFDSYAVPTSVERLSEGRVSKFVPKDEVVRQTVAPRVDPRPHMDSDTLGTIYEFSVKLADHFGDELQWSTGLIGEFLAHRINAGANPTSAFFGVKQMIERMDGVAQPIKTIDPFEQDSTDVIVDVVNVRTPKSSSQAQWMQVVDESTKVPSPLTIWIKAGRKKSLVKGDKVRLSGVKVNAYKTHGEWQTTLAVVSETEIHHIERGDGEIIRNSRGTSKNRHAPWSVESKAHNWHDGQEEGETTDDYRVAMANRYVLDGSFGDEEYDAYLSRQKSKQEE